jgi:uncharacterized protein
MDANENWALVTGASAGIGKEFCHVLAEKKWNLVLTARREQLLTKLKQDLEGRYQIKVVILKADLLIHGDVEKVLEHMHHYGVSYLVNNAGILSRGEFDSKELEEANRVINLNITSMVHLTYGAIKNFKKLDRDCFILNVGSLNSYISTAGQAVYCASKAFVKSFTLAISEELRESRIRVSCLCPGGTESEIMEVAGAEVTGHGQRFMMSAQAVARIGIEGVYRNKLIIIPGWYNKISALMCRILPEASMTKISSKAMEIAVKLK